MARIGGIKRGLVVTTIILTFGLIHLGVGIGIVAQYSKYRDIFRQSVGLSAFNIVIGIYGIIAGVLGLVAVTQKRPVLIKSVAIITAGLGIFTLASLITGLVINSQSINDVRSRLSYRISTYIQNDESIKLIDTIQTKYQCCGENLWLDWARIQLGVTTGRISSPTSSVINSSSGKSMNNIMRGSRRRRQWSVFSSWLIEQTRQKRQISSGGIFNGLPSTYSVALPLSCCKQGGVSASNTLGGYCVVRSNNSTTSFYVRGCMLPVANIVVLQITGIVLINTCLAFLCVVFIPMWISLFSETFNPKNDDNNKQPAPQEMQQVVQNQNVGYYPNNNNLNVQQDSNYPQYIVYQY